MRKNKKIFITLMISLVMLSASGCLTGPEANSTVKPQAEQFILNLSTQTGQIYFAGMFSVVKNEPSVNKIGYKFDGWYEKPIAHISKDDIPVVFPYMLNEDTVLYAKWENDLPATKKAITDFIQANGVLIENIGYSYKVDDAISFDALEIAYDSSKDNMIIFATGVSCDSDSFLYVFKFDGFFDGSGTYLNADMGAIDFSTSNNCIDFTYSKAWPNTPIGEFVNSVFEIQFRSSAFIVNFLFKRELGVSLY